MSKEPVCYRSLKLTNIILARALDQLRAAAAAGPSAAAAPRLVRFVIEGADETAEVVIPFGIAKLFVGEMLGAAGRWDCGRRGAEGGAEGGDYTVVLPGELPREGLACVGLLMESGGACPPALTAPELLGALAVLDFLQADSEVLDALCLLGGTCREFYRRLLDLAGACPCARLGVEVLARHTALGRPGPVEYNTLTINKGVITQFPCDSYPGEVWALRTFAGLDPELPPCIAGEMIMKAIDYVSLERVEEFCVRDHQTPDYSRRIRENNLVEAFFERRTAPAPRALPDGFLFRFDSPAWEVYAVEPRTLLMGWRYPHYPPLGAVWRLARRMRGEVCEELAHSTQVVKNLMLFCSGSSYWDKYYEAMELAEQLAGPSFPTLTRFFCRNKMANFVEKLKEYRPMAIDEPMCNMLSRYAPQGRTKFYDGALTAWGAQLLDEPGQLTGLLARCSVIGLAEALAESHASQRTDQLQEFQDAVREELRKRDLSHFPSEHDLHFMRPIPSPASRTVCASWVNALRRSDRNSLLRSIITGDYIFSYVSALYGLQDYPAEYMPPLESLNVMRPRALRLIAENGALRTAFERGIPAYGGLPLAELDPPPPFHCLRWHESERVARWCDLEGALEAAAGGRCRESWLFVQSHYVAQMSLPPGFEMDALEAIEITERTAAKLPKGELYLLGGSMRAHVKDCAVFIDAWHRLVRIWKSGDGDKVRAAWANGLRSENSFIYRTLFDC